MSTVTIITRDTLKVTPKVKSIKTDKALWVSDMGHQSNCKSVMNAYHYVFSLSNDKRVKRREEGTTNNTVTHYPLLQQPLRLIESPKPEKDILEKARGKGGRGISYFSFEGLAARLDEMVWY